MKPAMNELKIVELPNNRYTVWYNGESLKLSKKDLVPKVLEILKRCTDYLLTMAL